MARRESTRPLSRARHRGLGPGGGGGGSERGGGGGFGTAGSWSPPSAGGGPSYGGAPLLPLIGGSGGGGGGALYGSTASGGVGGGGAIVVASSGTLTLTGAIVANGGEGGDVHFPGGAGSGGAVRLVATRITGSGGQVTVRGGEGHPWGFGRGGLGRIRVEAFTNTAALNFAGVVPSVALPTMATLPAAPTLRISAVGGVATPAAPAASFATVDVTLPATTTNPVSVDLAGANIPPGSAVTVSVVGRVGGASSTTTTLTGTQTSTTGTTSVTLPLDQPSVIEASTSFPITAANRGPVFVDGEMVERVRVSATLGGAGQVTYVTRSEREVVVAQRERER